MTQLLVLVATVLVMVVMDSASWAQQLQLQNRFDNSSNLLVAMTRSHHHNNHRNHKRQQASSNSVVRSMRNSNFKVTALVDKSVTLTCSIELDDKEFAKSGNYKIIWSKEIENGRDYEPLALDDTRLASDPRIHATRLVINKQSIDHIQWNLIINNLKLTDSTNYICQLNQKPYDVNWLKKFTLNVYEPASFIDDASHSNESNPLTEYENSIFVKSVNELDDFKLRCNSRGRPKPTVTWFLRYLNGTQIQLGIDSNEILIRSIKRSSKIDKVECQISNGYGATVTRSFKINIRHRPYMHTKPRLYRVPVRTQEIRLNCSMSANPMPQVHWYFLPSEQLKAKLLDTSRAISTATSNSSGSKYGFDEIEMDDQAWKSINSVASYSYRHVNTPPPPQSQASPLLHASSLAAQMADSSNGNEAKSQIVKLPLSKYQIFEKRNVNHVTSSLEIKLINEKDYGLYRCFASNELGNQSVDFRIQELNYESVNNERMRSLLNREHDGSSSRMASSSAASKGNGDQYEENYAVGGTSDDDNDDNEDEEVRESTYYYDRSNSNHHFNSNIVFACLLIFSSTTMFYCCC